MHNTRHNNTYTTSSEASFRYLRVFFPPYFDRLPCSVTRGHCQPAAAPPSPWPTTPVLPHDVHVHSIDYPFGSRSSHPEPPLPLLRRQDRQARCSPICSPYYLLPTISHCASSLTSSPLIQRFKSILSAHISQARFQR